MDRDTFLKKLTSMSMDEIHDFIKSNGKGPKPIQLVCHDSESMSEDSLDANRK